ncbi:MAG: GGDEF domain-containing protein [Ruminococcus sp.]|nr:GGDEF domain-containing protein [Ruminococcus sp.]
MMRILESLKGVNIKATEKKIYRGVFIGCAVVHFICLLFFMQFDAILMEFLNAISVLLYIAMIIESDKWSFKFMGTTAFLEMSIHSIFATLALGWNFGFSLYLICVIPLAFYIPYKRIRTSFIMSLIAVALFTLLKFYASSEAFEAYRGHHLSVSTVNVVYIMNSIISFTMLLALSLIYNISINRAKRALEVKNEMLRELAYTDPLTKLSNRHSMYRSLHKSFIRAESEGTAFSIILSDIDDFKIINDTYGHNSGDMVLKRIAEIFKENVPENANVCRWGGEEILVLLPDCEVEQGAEIADNLRRTIEAEIFKSGKKKFSTTMTFGVSENKGQFSVDKMISNADKNLYSGKKSGKNCVIC